MREENFLSGPESPNQLDERETVYFLSDRDGTGRDRWRSRGSGNGSGVGFIGGTTQHDRTRHDMMRCDIQLNMTRHNRIWQDTTRHHTIQCDTT